MKKRTTTYKGTEYSKRLDDGKYEMWCNRKKELLEFPSLNSLKNYINLRIASHNLQHGKYT